MTIDNKITPFGKPMRKHWMFDPLYTPLNHGSYGAYPFPVREKRREMQELNDLQPDTYIRVRQTAFLRKSRAEVAALINAPMDECVYVKNSTTSIATVLYNLNFQEKESLVYFDHVYGALENGIVSLEEHSPLQTRKVAFSFPIEESELERRFRETVRQARADGLKVRAALFDTITSSPAARFPFELMTAVCREEGILSIIDGAHGIGMIPLDMQELQPDFFVTNCHKWLYTPRPVSLLYCPKRNQQLLRTQLPTSWGFIPASTPAEAFSAPPHPKNPNPNTLFEHLFQHGATSDDSAYVSVPAALKFRREVCGGEEVIMSYCRALANEGADIVAIALGTDVLQEMNLKPGQKSRMRNCCVNTVRLPIGVVNGDDEPEIPGSWVTLSAKEWSRAWIHMQKRMMRDFSTFVPIAPYGSWLYVRVSGQVYLERSDFEWLADVLHEMCREVADKKY
ncbi:hypothetical protein N7478_003015 [Penicillium angulare]|uniref:uncharacterized protein n=1 Tax=Penicillium angulare TaxID=116970 RepID=UPI00254000A8|nr:uncharacterized protein N7478_003015 [Penicillium angulare]KAJ5287329.1 hypothetical protein N7478_003015 [Penicillium angulare]